MVIADDFTGALDTGVQFKAKDSIVLVYKQGDETLRETMKKDIQVLIVDTETRHMNPEKAFQIVYDIVKIADEFGVSYIYKKTDSGMRGNVGSELTAALQASKEKNIHFIPAFPKMGRTTVEGVHYIDGVPVAESVFGRDPFNPVKKSAVEEIIAEQSDVKVCLMGKKVSGCDQEGIFVYDSSTDEDMQHLAMELSENGKLHLLAGCAGFAAILIGLLDLETQDITLPEFQKNLLTVCGSINAVTIRQLDYASNNGMHRVHLTPEQKLDKGWIESEEGKTCISAWKEDVRNYGDMILECGVHDFEQTSEYMMKKGMELAEARESIAGTLGGILKGMLDRGTQATLLVTGGDTLLAFMQHMKQNALVPMCELLPGVVLSQFEYCGIIYNLISKSGGFGQENLLMTLSKIIKEENQ